MTEQRFWSKVNKTESCWLWTGHCNYDNYGEFCFNSKTVGAHRYSYILHNGEIAKGLVVRHTCDNPPCVNPNHLFIGTHQDNMNDMVERNRQAKGVKNGRSKLSEDDVREIRIFREFGFTQRELGKMYGVSHILIGFIVRKETWSHI